MLCFDGNDTLNGGAGADRFKFITTAEGVDAITDFESGSDKIQVVGSNFGGLATGKLAADRFKAAGTPLDTGAAVSLYDNTTGALSFDHDGSGSAAAVQWGWSCRAGARW
jgi:Ca2+-binding RTX toxin-like protein